MTSEGKQDLLTLITETHSATRSMVEEVDPELRVYGETGWRVRDIIGHIATWEREVTKSILAFVDGEEYATPNLNNIHEFNQTEVAKLEDLTAQQILDEWKDTNQDFKDAVSSIPLDMLPVHILFPWVDERGDIALLVKYVCNHDIEHREEIKEAISGE